MLFWTIRYFAYHFDSRIVSNNCQNYSKSSLRSILALDSTCCTLLKNLSSLPIDDDLSDMLSIIALLLLLVPWILWFCKLPNFGFAYLVIFVMPFIFPSLWFFTSLFKRPVYFIFVCSSPVCSVPSARRIYFYFFSF